VGLVDRGHRLSRQELSVEQRDSVASLTSREENALAVGRVEATREEQWVGDRLQRRETIGVGCSGSSRETHSEINKIAVKKVQRCDREDSFL